MLYIYNDVQVGSICAMVDLHVAVRDGFDLGPLSVFRAVKYSPVSVLEMYIHVV